MGFSSRAAFLATHMAVSVGVFAWIGWYVGGRSGHAKGGALAGIFLALLSSLYELWKIVRAALEEEREDLRDPRP